MDKPCIVVAVTSSIAAYKSVQLVSDLLKLGYDVEVMMSKNATEFIQPLTFSTLTKHKTVVDTFERTTDYNVEHISFAKKADLCIVAPATANIIAKMAHGLADDFISTTLLAMKCPILVAPAMNTAMYENPITQKNITTLKEVGIHFIEPTSGLLACNDIGTGKLAPIEDLIDEIEYLLSEKPLLGRSVLISAGPTIEYIDPVRYISNPSSGKMGYALAKQARNFGASVTLVHGLVHLPNIRHVNHIETLRADDMYHVFLEEYKAYDIIIKAAAVADYKVDYVKEQKIKKQDDPLVLTLHKNKDILKTLGEQKLQNQVLCGFAMESEHLLENAQSKKVNKNLDLIVANNIKEEGAGFQSNDNKIYIIADEIIDYPLASKQNLAKEILLQCIIQLTKKELQNI